VALFDSTHAFSH